ncbi:DUF4056 domain-containing protein [Aquimarina litoralis]|uniref:DUF4056 domain-containing protein n=1 Tax=Aquimarina litoralis TaxID=584605 RepID=UPI001C56F9E3|nr:DUF4056 domain-containing protein [Aquimarina litoralis]MBW1296838.1 DUF4056 domain-containing protein [Aquimarina litoralis]
MKFVINKTTLQCIKFLILLCLIAKPIAINAQKIQEDEVVNLNKIPPRIIRACCAFGYDLKIWGIPFVSIDQVISIDDLNEHHYMGNKREGTGTIYTTKGGFIDIGHLRDQLDWTRFIHATIINSKGKGEVILPLRNEAGRKTLYLNIPEQLNDHDSVLLAGKITYDLSLWHEISTWFGASTVPFISEKFSSFSVEDVYSNLLGIHIGMKTLRSKQPFNKTATEVIASTLDSLGVVKTAKETYDAYDAINNKWYTNKKRIPSAKITLKRDLNILKSSNPWIIPNHTTDNNQPVVLDVPISNTKGELLTNFYQFTIDLNYRIPVEEIFPNRKNNIINQDDFSVLINRISQEIQIKEQSVLAQKKEIFQK